MKKQFLSYFSILFFTFSFAQDKVIEGHVFELVSEDSISPLPGVNVLFQGSTNGTTTNSEGYFKLINTQEYSNLIFSFTGFESDTVDVQTNKEVNVILSEGKILDEFEVLFEKGSYSFSKFDPRDAQIISQGELRKAACCNLAASFETNPSIDASFTDAVTGSKQIQMLGLSGKYVQLLSSNLPTVRGLSVLYGLEEIPGPWINGIYVSKGAGSVLNGFESMVGQINLDLKQPGNAEKMHLNVYGNQAGNIESNFYYSTKVGKKWETTVLAHSKNNQFENDRNNDGFLDNPLVDRYILRNQWNFRSNRIHMELGADAVYIDARAGNLNLEDSLTPSSSEGAYRVNLTTNKIGGFAKIGYLFPDDDFKSLALQLSGTQVRQKSLFGLKRYNGIQNSAYANLIFQKKIGSSKGSLENYFKTGISFQYDNANETLSSGDTAFSMNGNYVLNEMIPGAYFEFTYGSEKAGLIAGLRADFSTIYGGFITPRVHFRYNFSNETVLKLMAGSGRRTPFLIMENVGFLPSSRDWVLHPNAQNTSNSSNPFGLEQEISWNFGCAFLKEFELLYREGSVHIDVYHTFFQNQLVVDLDQTAREVHFYNLQGQSISNSFQLELNYELFKRFDIRLAYRYLDVFSNYSGQLREKPLLSRNRGFVNLAYETKKRKAKQWKFDLTAQWIGSQRIPFTRDNPQELILNGRSDDYFLMNAQFTRVFGKRLEIYLGAENLLNYTQKNPILSAENPFGEFFESALIWAPIFGRMYYGGVRFTLGEIERE